MRARDIMSPACFVDAEATLAEVADALARSGAPSATVSEGGRVIGVVTAGELLAHWPHGAAAHRGRSEPRSGRSFADEPE